MESHYRTGNHQDSYTAKQHGQAAYDTIDLQQSDILGKANYELDNTYPKYMYSNPWLDYGRNTCITAIDIGSIGVYEACHYKIMGFKEFMEDVKNWVKN